MLTALGHIKAQWKLTDISMATCVSWADKQEVGNGIFVRNDTYFWTTDESVIILNGLRAQPSTFIQHLYFNFHTDASNQ